MRTVDLRCRRRAFMLPSALPSLPLSAGLPALAPTSRPSSAARSYPGYHLLAVEDARLFKGIVVDHDVACRLDVVENASSTDEDIALDCKLHASAGGSRLMPAYGARVMLTKSPAKPMQFTDASLQRAPGALRADELYNGETLFHGPLFQGISELLSYDEHRLTARCHKVPLSPIEQGQFSARHIDAFTADIALQTMLIWARLLRGAGSLPSACESFQFVEPFPENGEYYVTLVNPDWKPAGLAVECYMHDAGGKVFVKGFMSTTLDKTLSCVGLPGNLTHDARVFTEQRLQVQIGRSM